MSILFLSINIVLFAVPTCALLLTTFPNKLRVPPSVAVPTVLCAGTVLQIFTGISYAENSPLYPWRLVIRTVWIVVLYILVRILISGEPSQIFFSALVFTNYMDSISLFAKATSYFFFHVDPEKIYSWYYVISKLLVLGILFPPIALFTVRLLRPAIEEGGKMPFWKYLWIIPLSHFALYRTGISPEFNSGVVWRGNTFLLPCVWMVGIFLSYFILLKMLTGVVKKIQLEERLHVYEMQISMQKEQYAILQENIEETRRAKHDLRHHLHAVQGYIEAQDCKGMEQYLKNCIEALEEQTENRETAASS